MTVKARLLTFWSEVRRRKVFRAGSIYLIAAWTLALGAAELFPAFGIPDWGVRLFVIAGVLGFPLVLIGAWLFEITSEGVVLDRVAHRPLAQPLEPPVSSTVTTWAQHQHVTVRWQDESGSHQREFRSDFTLGRDAVAQLKIDDPRISRLHARVCYERGLWWIEDLASRNGTRVDGRLIMEKTPLGDGSTVRLYEGGYPITIQVNGAAPEP